MEQMIDLSILIPARSEMFLSRTVEELIANCEGNTEIIVVLDGQWAEPTINYHPMVNVIYLPEPIGQRAATNMACKIARGKYVAKVDAHCSFDKGFDRKMVEGFKKVGDNVVMVPVMRNLWVFDWRCKKCGKKWYQGPTPTECKEDNFKRTGKPCDGKEFERRMMWVGKEKPQSTSFCFDSEPHFQYNNEHKKTDKYKEELKTGFTETMSLQGSFFMCTREKYWELNICDERFGSWGSQGIEISTKFWLTGGRVLVNHSTWYAHLFRTQGGDFGFPYKNDQKDKDAAKAMVRDMVYNNKIPNQIHPIHWLIEKFYPVKGWTDAEIELLKQGKL